ncbi:MAG: hypothetical protein DMG97_21000 [Acidobacteria bacterium]|nr:MAG: hypothetical protein DMG98_10945 [Acidobacteriota bacterium]PYV69298.1 MAG: hypothetical protein DMG96_34330 [Acidobacteriota bacterium]PYV69780.1 MAG: hypothetical protein DMG97_21000 [Acidobacteriota bacterium]
MLSVGTGEPHQVVDDSRELRKTKVVKEARIKAKPIRMAEWRLRSGGYVRFEAFVQKKRRS